MKVGDMDGGGQYVSFLKLWALGVNCMGKFRNWGHYTFSQFCMKFDILLTWTVCGRGKFICRKVKINMQIFWIKAKKGDHFK